MCNDFRLRKKSHNCGFVGFIYLWQGGLSGWRGSPRRVGLLVRYSDLSVSLAVAVMAVIAASLDWGMHEGPLLLLAFMVIKTSSLVSGSCDTVAVHPWVWLDVLAAVGRVVCCVIVRSWWWSNWSNRSLPPRYILARWPNKDKFIDKPEKCAKKLYLYKLL